MGIGKYRTEKTFPISHFRNAVDFTHHLSTNIIGVLKTDWKHSLSYFLLASFLLLRVVNLHTVFHCHDHEEVEHCDQCHLIMHANQSMPLQIANEADFSFSSLLVIEREKEFLGYEAPYQKIRLSDYFCNKPPPFL